MCQATARPQPLPPTPTTSVITGAQLLSRSLCLCWLLIFLIFLPGQGRLGWAPCRAGRLWCWWGHRGPGGSHSPVGQGDVMEAAAGSLGQGSTAVGCIGARARAGWWWGRGGQQHQLRARPGPEALGSPHHSLPQLLGVP